jgi:DNA-binding MarR family transcriptional regulator
MTQPAIEVTHAPVLAAQVRALTRKLKQRLREQADIGDLTGSQTVALIRLEQEGPMTLAALARAEGVRPQSMSATVAALQQAGHVAGAPDPTDGRQTLLAITPQCRAWIEAGRAARQDWLVRAILTRLTASEQDQLREAIGLLERLIA